MTWNRSRYWTRRLHQSKYLHYRFQYISSIGFTRVCFWLNTSCYSCYMYYCPINRLCTEIHIDWHLCITASLAVQEANYSNTNNNHSCTLSDDWRFDCKIKSITSWCDKLTINSYIPCFSCVKSTQTVLWKWSSQEESNHSDLPTWYFHCLYTRNGLHHSIRSCGQWKCCGRSLVMKLIVLVPGLVDRCSLPPQLRNQTLR